MLDVFLRLLGVLGLGASCNAKRSSEQRRCVYVLDTFLRLLGVLGLGASCNAKRSSEQRRCVCWMCF